MIPKIKVIMSSDIDNLQNFVPQIPDLFEIAISLEIGIEGEIAQEIFQISIITPKWLLSNCKTDEVFIPRHYLIVQRYNYQKIIEKFNQICKHCSGVNWDDCSLKLSRYFQWEFEDYRVK